VWRVWQFRGESLVNVIFIKTNTSYLCIDLLTTVQTALYALALLHEHVGQGPIVGMIYSHTHSDHFGGVKGMITNGDLAAVGLSPQKRFTNGFWKNRVWRPRYADRNDYMYGENLEISPTGLLDTWLGQMIEGGEVSYIEPTDVIGKQGGQMIIDGVKIEFMFAPGEAPTDMHFYSPQHKLLDCSDNCYMCLHTVHTIRGAFPRDAMQWANSATE
jgi:alkyl sulfatase BDS1-like metallo-beta-lactamase superfamily hydrolase